MQTKKQFDVIGIGSPVVDVLSRQDEEFLAKHRLVKKSECLIDRDIANYYSDIIVEAKIASGGSCANTIANMSSLGSKTSFIGKISNDSFGELFTTGMAKEGVSFFPIVEDNSAGTARCFSIVTPDGERTMATYLGVAGNLNVTDLKQYEEKIAQGNIFYTEGYLWDQLGTKQAINYAMTTLKATGGKAALSLSDSFCVNNQRDSFLDLIKNSVDILFANEDEINALLQTQTVEEAIMQVKSLTDFAIITKGSSGSVIVKNGICTEIAPVKVAKVVDTTGAGDAYASGFLHGISQGWGLEESGALASKLASEIIQHMGARK
jgi:sugar/nucleoside kinase (ribokinase family)